MALLVKRTVLITLFLNFGLGSFTNSFNLSLISSTLVKFALPIHPLQAVIISKLSKSMLVLPYPS